VASLAVAVRQTINCCNRAISLSEKLADPVNESDKNFWPLLPSRWPHTEETLPKPGVDHIGLPGLGKLRCDLLIVSCETVPSIPVVRRVRSDAGPAIDTGVKSRQSPRSVKK
jgi:hypothetical protein